MHRLWRCVARAWWLSLLTLLLLPVAAGDTSVASGHVTPNATPSGAPATPSPMPSATPEVCNVATQWNPPNDNVGLDGFSMTSASEGWVTGLLRPGLVEGSSTSPAVLYHLVNGQWHRLSQTYPGAELTSLSMDSPTDGWAVSPYPIKGSTHPLVLHYVGSAWQTVDVPALDAVLRPPPGYLETHIQGITVQMFTPSTGWMFVQTDIPADLKNPASRARVLVLRYENNRWTTIPGPTVASTVELPSLSAVSADEAWIVGTDYGSTSETTLFFHYIDGGWTLVPQTFPFIAQSLTMVSPTDGWAGNGDGDNPLLHYDGTRWAPFPIPSALAKQRGILLGNDLIYSIAPGIAWFGTSQGDAPGIWQDANGTWSQVAWPYPDLLPDALAAGGDGEVWGIANILHQLGCAPALVTETPQGVFLHETNGSWTRQVLP